FPREPQAVRGGDYRVTHHADVVQRVVKAQWKTHDQQGGADLDSSAGAGQMAGGECAVGRGAGQSGPFDLDHGNVDLTGSVEALAPEALAVAVQRNGKAGGSRHVVRIGMQLDLDAVREVLARLVHHHVPARHQKQPSIALEEEAAGIRQGALVLEGLYAGAREKERVGHDLATVFMEDGLGRRPHGRARTDTACTAAVLPTTAGGSPSAAS